MDGEEKKLAKQSRYKPEYCQKLIDFMAQGYSLKAFGPEVKVCRDTLYEWMKVHPEFKEAHELGYMSALKFFETMLISCARGVIPEQLKRHGSKKLDITAIIFALKTRFHEEYGERLKQDINTNAPSQVVIMIPDNGKAKPE